MPSGEASHRVFASRLFTANGHHYCFHDDLDQVLHGCRWTQVMTQLLNHVPRCTPTAPKPCNNNKAPPRATEVKNQIAASMKSFFKTEEGRESKKKAFEKRSETMKHKREQLRASVTEKECRACGQMLSVEMFCRKAAAADGYQPYCKPCTQLKKKKIQAV